MICRYCGEEIRSLADNLTGRYGQKCKSSPTERHVAVSDGEHCIYCGRKTKTMAGSLRTDYGTRCKNSPTQTHALDK